MSKKQSKSARIRKLLDQGKSVKHIAATVKCTPALVYQVKAYDKKKAAPKKVAKPQEWVMVETSTSKEPIGIPKDVYYEHMQPNDHVPPLDYYQPKRNVVQRFFNWLCGG